MVGGGPPLPPPVPATPYTRWEVGSATIALTLNCPSVKRGPPVPAAGSSWSSTTLQNKQLTAPSRVPLVGASAGTGWAAATEASKAAVTKPDPPPHDLSKPPNPPPGHPRLRH